MESIFYQQHIGVEYREWLSSQFWFFFFLNYVKVLELYWLLTILKTKQNKTKLSCITEVGIVQGWDKAFFNLFHTTYWFWCRNLIFSYLFHALSHLLFTTWTWTPVAPSGWTKSNDIFLTWLSEAPWEFSDNDFIKLHCSLK